MRARRRLDDIGADNDINAIVMARSTQASLHEALERVCSTPSDTITRQTRRTCVGGEPDPATNVGEPGQDPAQTVSFRNALRRPQTAYKAETFCALRVILIRF